MGLCNMHVCARASVCIDMNIRFVTQNVHWYFHNSHIHCNGISISASAQYRSISGWYILCIISWNIFTDRSYHFESLNTNLFIFLKFPKYIQIFYIFFFCKFLQQKNGSKLVDFSRLQPVKMEPIVNTSVIGQKKISLSKFYFFGKEKRESKREFLLNLIF